MLLDLIKNIVENVFQFKKKNHLVRKLEMYVLEQSPSSVHKTTVAYIKLSFFGNNLFKMKILWLFIEH